MNCHGRWFGFGFDVICICKCHSSLKKERRYVWLEGQQVTPVHHLSRELSSMMAIDNNIKALDTFCVINLDDIRNYNPHEFFPNSGNLLTTILSYIRYCRRGLLIRNV